MGDIRIIVDLPNEDMQRALRLPSLYARYDSERLKKSIEFKLAQDFPEARSIKVNIVASNAFFGIDVMGLNAQETLDAMKKVSDAISPIIKEYVELQPAKL